MAHHTQADFFLQAAQSLNIPLVKKHAALFETYFKELISWNKKINLTRITERKKVFVDHFIDSLLPERFIPQKSRLIDLGSGGGFPGIPLKIIRPDLSITLVDSSLKKIIFLRHLIRTLGLREVMVIQERIELLHCAGKSYDVCIGRAFAPLPKYLPIALPLRAPQGTIIALKGPNYASELAAVEPQLCLWGIETKKIENFLLPFTNKKRVLMVFG